jgi:hypothetical protein
MHCCLKTRAVDIDSKKHFASVSTLTTVTLFAALTATLVACGGGESIQFPEPQASGPEAAQQRKATAAQAIELTQSLRQAVTQAVASGQKLTDVKDTVNAKAVTLPRGGTITEVRLEYGGAIVADVTLPTSQSAPATSVGTGSNPSGASASSAASLVDTGLPSAAGARGQLVWVAYPVAQGLVRWYCFGNFPTASQDTDGACLYPGESARGVTWGTQGDAPAGRFPTYDAKLNLSYVGCDIATPPSLHTGFTPGGCGAEKGDWPVFQKLPLLCVLIDGRPLPVGWTLRTSFPLFLRGEMAVTAPVYGIQLLGNAPGNALCSQQFGAGWEIANQFTGNTGGFIGNGRTPTDTRFWVVTRWTTQANPWCATLTGLPCFQ